MRSFFNDIASTEGSWQLLQAAHNSRPFHRSDYEHHKSATSRTADFPSKRPRLAEHHCCILGIDHVHLTKVVPVREEVSSWLPHNSSSQIPTTRNAVVK